MHPRSPALVSRVLGALAVLVGLMVGGLASAAPARAATAPRVVVVAIPDLRWSDLSPSATPALWTLLSTGASGALSVKSQWQLAGCADGLLTLGAGDRVAAERADRAALPCTGSELRARPQTDGAGALADALRAAGLRTAALGDGAALALPGANRIGPLGIAPPTDVDVVLAVDDGVYAAQPQARRQAVEAVDARVAGLVSPLPRSTTVLVVGSSDRPAAPGESGPAAEAHLHVAIARGPDFPPGALSSPSTKRAPYVELIDLAPTVLDVVGATIPSTMVGRAWQPATTSAKAAGQAAHLRDLDVKAVQGAHWRPLFMWVLSGLALAVGVLALLLVRRRAGRRARTAAELAGYLVASLPMASWLVQLVPWWRSVVLLPVLLAVVAGAVAVVATLCARRRSVLGLVVVTALSTAVLVVDLLTHSRLQTSALLGDSPITAGRFYGAGNTAFGVLAASALLGTAVLAAGPTTDRRGDAGARLVPRLMGAAVVLLAVAAVDGAPSLGADLGGALSFLPSAVLLLLLLTGVRRSWRGGLLAVVVGVVPVVAVALWDYHRPADRRTHIGDFVGQVIHGQAGSVLGRKLSANLHQLVSSPFLPLVIGTVALVSVAVWLERPRLQGLLGRTPGLASGLTVVVVCAVLGGLLNDSGVTVTGIMLSVALPTVSALALRVDRIDPG
jgi:hypothetical protein